MSYLSGPIPVSEFDLSTCADSISACIRRRRLPAMVEVQDKKDLATSSNSFREEYIICQS